MKTELIPASILRVLAFRLPQEVFDQLTEVCQRTGQTKTDVIRAMVDEIIASNRPARRSTPPKRTASVTMRKVG